MPRQTMTYDILLSCPSDVEGEIAIIEDVMTSFNKMFGENAGITLNLKHWSQDTFAQSGGRAQELLNKQIVNNSDAAICILWTRFGTPTGEYLSGTEEEIVKFLDEGKQLFLYFSHIPKNPREIDMNQFQKVQDFERKVQEMDLIYYKSYDNLEKFREVITLDLTKYFTGLQSEESHPTEKKSTLSVKGIDNGDVSEKIILLPSPSRSTFLRNIVNKIHDMIMEISDIDIVQAIPNVDNQATSELVGFSINNLFGAKNYEFPREAVLKIEKYFEFQKIAVDRDLFFNVGNLKESRDIAYSAALGGSPYTYSGTDEEKSKREKLWKLHKKVSEYFDWLSYFQQFEGLNGFRLCLCNNGNTFDSDIDVTLTVDKESFVLLSDLTPPSEAIIEHINEIEFVDNTFGSKESINIKAYSYPRLPTTQYMPTPSTFPFSGPDYEELKQSYEDDIEYVMQVKVFEQSDKYVLKYHFNEIKQHTNIAFPSMFFVKDSNINIDYKINSKNNGDIQLGEIHS